jgi:predicted flavoprotein YhiN
LTTEKLLHELSGTSFSDASIHWGNQSFHGPLLLTHFGISGPLAFVLASHTAFEKIESEHPLTVLLQPDTSKSVDDRETILLQATQDDPRKALATILSQHFSKRFAATICSIVAIDPTQKVSTLTRDQRQSLTSLLGDGMPLTLVGRRPGDEFVTAGGVSRQEIDPKTMESKIVP